MIARTGFNSAAKQHYNAITRLHVLGRFAYMLVDTVHNGRKDAYSSVASESAIVVIHTECSKKLKICVCSIEISVLKLLKNSLPERPSRYILVILRRFIKIGRYKTLQITKQQNV